MNRLTSIKPAPIYLNKLPSPPPPLPPGVYQTYPYTIIIIVPGEIDEQSIGEVPSANLRMPEIHPETKVVPKSQTGQ